MNNHSVSRKPRHQGPLNHLTNEQRLQLHAWFRENLIYPEIRKRMWDKFQIATSAGSLSNYYSKHSFEIFEKESRVAAEVETKEVRLIIHIEIRPVFITPEPTQQP